MRSGWCISASPAPTTSSILYVPIAVFLGMHLLFTDPSTAPRTELGRVIFGALYGLSTILLYDLLGRAGLPTFYDKLLQVPLLNLTIQRIDRAVRGTWLRRFDPAAIGRSLAPRRRNLAYVTLWATVFAAHQRRAGSRRSAPRPVGSVLAGGVRRRTFRRVRLTSHSCTRRFAMPARNGRAASSAPCGRAGGSMRRTTAELPPVEELPILLRGSKGPITRSNADTFVRSCMRAGVVAASTAKWPPLSWQDNAGEP